MLRNRACSGRWVGALQRADVSICIICPASAPRCECRWPCCFSGAIGGRQRPVTTKQPYRQGMAVPVGFKGAKPMPKVGWAVTAEAAPVAAPYDRHGQRVTEDVRVVRCGSGQPGRSAARYALRRVRAARAVARRAGAVVVCDTPKLWCGSARLARSARHRHFNYRHNVACCTAAANTGGNSATGWVDAIASRTEPSASC